MESLKKSSTATAGAANSFKQKKAAYGSPQAAESIS
jgi:hypothetical protein